MSDLKGQCPFCDAEVRLSENTESSEIVSCTDCAQELEVKEVNKENQTVFLKEAPQIEEDWGE